MLMAIRIIHIISIQTLPFGMLCAAENTSFLLYSTTLGMKKNLCATDTENTNMQQQNCFSAE
jgi:hypothetical protein